MVSGGGGIGDASSLVAIKKFALLPQTDRHAVVDSGCGRGVVVRAFAISMLVHGHTRLHLDGRGWVYPQ